MKSIWKQDVVLKVNKELTHDTSVNTLVIGSGMAGILTAYLLKKKGIDAIVLEAARIGSGQTQNTTAKITSQHGLFYSRLTHKVSHARLRNYAMANEAAIDMYEQIINTEKIDCDFVRLPAVLYTTDGRNTKILQKEAKIAKKMGIDAYYKDCEAVKSKVIGTSLESVNMKGAVYFNNQAQFHPLKFLKEVAKELTIYENTPVLAVKGHTVYTNRSRIEADHIVFATHYPFINMPGFYFLREHQERSYVLALEGEPLPAMYYSMDKDGLSFRSHGDLLLLGGGSHRTGKRATCKNEEVGYTFLRKMKEKYFPDEEIVAAWSAQDCMTHDEIPFIGKYSHFRPYWYVATGFKKWGMTSSMIAAEIISNQIQRANAGINSSLSVDKQVLQYEKAFSPQRMLVRAAFVDFMVDIGESIAGLCKGVFSSQKRKCPHMGCRLEWNCEEKSWDCPCHGSRFTNEGELKDNPAQTDIRE